MQEKRHSFTRLNGREPEKGEKGKEARSTLRKKGKMEVSPILSRGKKRNQKPPFYWREGRKRKTESPMQREGRKTNNGNLHFPGGG